MKTLLVLAKQSGLAAAIRVVVDPDRYRVLAQEELWEAESFLLAGSVDACVLDADLTDIQPIRIIKQIRRLAPRCPILVYAAIKQWEWEEEAYLLGVGHVLTKPVRARLLNALLERLWPDQGAPDTAAKISRPPIPEARPPEPAREPARTLATLRHFSGILTHSLCSEALLKQFLLLLREIIGVNRAAIFLRKQPGGVAPSTTGQEHRRLRASCALGLPASLLEHFELTLEAGIGRYVYRSGRILKSGSDEARGDLEIQKEFELLGAQVAIPILDRESLVGVAVFDGRLTGEFFANEELALIFHLLEEVGLALKNSWLYDQLAANHAMMADVLNQLTSGCVVVSSDLEVLHANPVARRMLAGGKAAPATLDFSEIPTPLASKVFEALKTSAEPSVFLHRPSPREGTVYRVMITPFKGPADAAANAVLVTLEDFTSTEQSQRLEIEAANLRLIRAMASHLAHEIGNTLVPINTAQQFRSQSNAEPPPHDPLSQAVAESIRRIMRLTQQMRFLAQDAAPSMEPLPLEPLIQEAFREAQAHQKEPAGQLQLQGAAEDPDQPPVVRGDRHGLKYALAEVLLNALQANPPGAPVQVRWQTDTNGPHRWLHINVADAGSGFTAESARRATEPFYTTRTVGLGLGLTVAQKIVETHQGRVEITPDSDGQPSLVRISLPLVDERDDPRRTRQTEGTP